VNKIIKCKHLVHCKLKANSLQFTKHKYIEDNENERGLLNEFM